MISCLTIKNFQVHKKLSIQLDPHITTIVGPTDSGKSAVIRALRWLVFNRPSGESFIHDGKKEASVAIEISKGSGSVVIERTKGVKNVYAVDGEDLTAFGADVPQNIIDILNLSPINFQQQHDSPFWFSETAGEVSRQLNSIINLSVIDNTLANLASVLRSSRAEVDVTKARLSQCVEARSQLKFARKMDTDLKVVEGLQDKWNEITQQWEEMSDTVESITELATQSKLYTDFITAGSSVLLIGEKWKEVHTHQTELDSLLQKAKAQEKEAKQIIPNLAPVIKAEESRRVAVKALQNIQSLYDEIQNWMDTKEEKERELKKCQASLSRLMGKKCLLCGQVIRES